MYSLMLSLRDAWRSLRHNVGTTLIAGVLLAAGFTISLVITSLSRSAFQSVGSPIPLDVMVIGEADGAGNVDWMRGSEILELQAAAPEALADATAVRSIQLSLNTLDRNLSVSGTLVSGALFTHLDWPLQIGRDFQPEDADRGAVVLGHALWRSAFGADPGIVGRTVRVDGLEVHVIGVLPPHRAYPFQQQLYLAHRLDAQSNRLNQFWEFSVRVTDDDQRARLQQAVAAVQAERLAKQGDAAREAPLQLRAFLGNGVPVESQVLLGMLMLMGALLLLLASSNAGGLLLVHWLGRLRELATRAALGSTRRRLLGVCVAQSTVLVGLALLLAHALAALLLAWLQDYLHSGSNGIPAYMQLTLLPEATWPVLAAAVISVLVVAAPVLWRLRSADLQGQIRSGERGNSQAGWLGSSLFGLQCLLSAMTVLLTLLCAEGARQMMAVQPGLDTAQVLTARFAHADPAKQASLARALESVLRADPQVEAVSIAASLPMAVQPQIRLQQGEHSWLLGSNPVDADYARVYGVRVEQGRWFDATQVSSGASVLVLDRTAAEALFPAGDAVGRTLEEPQPDGSVVQHVVQAVVAPVRTVDDPGADKPSVFRPVQVGSARGLILALRTRDADPLSYAATLESKVRQIDPALALSELRSFEQVRDDVGSTARLLLSLFTPLGSLALLLACAGLAALLGSLVARRQRELGIRRALGAPRAGLVKPLLGRLSVWGGCGLLLGLLAAWPLAGAMDQMFNGAALGMAIPLTTLLVLLAGFALAALPALRRALRTDPMRILREE